MNKNLSIDRSKVTSRSLVSVLILRLLWAISLVIIFSLLILYIFQINDLTSKIYSVQTNEKKLDKLSFENKNSEISFSAANSLGNIELQIASLNLERIGEIKYIKVMDSQVARLAESDLKQ